MNLPFGEIDHSWTLFLDRDGVINKRIVGGYVKSIDEFEFLPGVLDAISKFSKIFGKIIVVTNQQGIGKGLMNQEDLEKVHRYMLDKIQENGGKIDAVFYAPFLASENNPIRKPGIGMALMAKEKYPQIVFSKSLMVGDSPSDMDFGKNAGMKCIFINYKKLKTNYLNEVTSLVELSDEFDLNT